MLELRDLYVSTDNDDTAAVCALVQRSLNTDLPVQLKTLTGGITNQLLEAKAGTSRVLVRVFGRGTATFIDREREFCVHLKLAELKMAAPLYCKFGNGLVYAWAEGTPLEYTQMGKEPIALAIAQRLGQWHKNLKLDLPTSSIYGLIQSWIPLVPEGVLPMSKHELQEEIEWFQTQYAHVQQMVLGHNDLLCGNILLQRDGEVAFIDYEYAQECPRAYDIANHFMEWQGYDCQTDKIPSLDDPLIQKWFKVYLDAAGSSSTVAELREEVQAFYGLPGLYWSIWSAIQSTQSEIDFNYVEYAKLRFKEYLRWKVAK